MYASRHAVFVGPGKLPGELRDVLHRRAGAPQPDIAIQTPRLLAIFESAADAERLASQVQRLKLGAVVAGPEQPPTEAAWAVARALELVDGRWRVTTELSELVIVQPEQLTAVTIVDWRPTEAAADRAVLLTFREARPVLLRASSLDQVSRLSVPLEGMRRVSEFLEAAALDLEGTLRVRTRRLAEADFRPQELTGDLLPLVLGVVDAVDSIPGELPRPLARRRPSHEALHVVDTTTLGRGSAWVLHGTSLLALPLSLGLLGVAVLGVNPIPGAIGVAVGAWATFRFMWARWLARENWAETPPIPAWPINPEERGLRPRALELLMDAVALGALGAGTLGEGAVQVLSFAGLPLVGLGAAAALGAVWDARNRS